MPVGLFGKYPGKRDFLALNLPRGVADVIEPWLQKAVAISRERLGRRWQDYYFIHPIWSFRLGAGITGSDCIGALMPSVDGVGRCFPLCILAHAPAGTAFPLHGDIPGEWTGDLHARLLSALSEDEVPDPESLLAGLGDPPPAAMPEGMIKLAGGYALTGEGGEDDDLSARFAAAEVFAAARGRALFWTEGGQYVPPRILSFAGMPDPALYTMMMGGTGDGDA